MSVGQGYQRGGALFLFYLAAAPLPYIHSPEFIENTFIEKGGMHPCAP